MLTFSLLTEALDVMANIATIFVAVLVVRQRIRLHSKDEVRD